MYFGKDEVETLARGDGNGEPVLSVTAVETAVKADDTLAGVATSITVATPMPTAAPTPLAKGETFVPTSTPAGSPPAPIPTAPTPKPSTGTPTTTPSPPPTSPTTLPTSLAPANNMEPTTESSAPPSFQFTGAHSICLIAMAIA